MLRERKANEQSMERERELSELRYYRALETERIKWEARKARLIAQLEVRSAREVTIETGASAGVTVVTTPSTTAATVVSLGEPLLPQALGPTVESKRRVGSTILHTEPRAAIPFTIESSVPRSYDTTPSSLRVCATPFIPPSTLPSPQLF